MKEKLKKYNGITLVALVITIIVLLILAGVSIAMLAGENGILGNSQEAVRKSENAQIQENATLADYESEIDIATSRETVSIDKTIYDKLKSNVSVTGNVLKDRPDTWIVGTEYKWVDGANEIFGKRFEGTINSSDIVLDNTFGDNWNFYDVGGTIYGTTDNTNANKYHFPFVYTSSGWESILWIDATHTHGGGLIMTNGVNLVGHGRKYDIWVIYKK